MILCYHNVVTEPERDSREPALHMAVGAFADQIDWLRRHSETVPLNELVSRIRRGQPTRGLAAVTFDDGYQGFFVAALPVLRACGVPAAVFLVADAPARRTPFWWDHPELIRRATPARRTMWLTQGRGVAAAIYEQEQVAAPDHLSSELLPAEWDTIRGCLGTDLTIGAHTCGHPALTSLGTAEVRQELQQSIQTIEAQLGTRPSILAYPYGDWNPSVREAAAAAGFAAALTLEARRLPATGADVLALPRINVPARITPAAFEAWASGLLPPPRARR